MNAPPSTTNQISTISRRRFLTFSVRTLVLVTAAIAVWLGMLVRNAEKQRRAVARLQELGASVRYDYQDANIKASPPGPNWLRNLIGDDYFCTVTFVFFQEGRKIQ